MHDVCIGFLTSEAVHFPENSFPRGRYQILGNTHLRTSCSALTREWRIGGQTSPYRILAQVERVAVQDRPVTTLPETPQLSETKSTFRIVVSCASTYGQRELTDLVESPSPDAKRARDTGRKGRMHIHNPSLGNARLSAMEQCGNFVASRLQFRRLPPNGTHQCLVRTVHRGYT